MKKYTYIEILTNGRFFVHCLSELNADYLRNLNQINKNESEKFNTRHIVAAFETDFIREKFNYVIPKNLDYTVGISDQILLEAIKISKKEELKIILSDEYKTYIKESEYKQHYYNLLEKEAIKHLNNNLTETVDKTASTVKTSAFLEAVAARKNTDVDTLASKIITKVYENYNIILNKEFLTADISAEIDQMTLEDIMNFEVVDEVKNRLYKLTALEIPDKKSLSNNSSDDYEISLNEQAKKPKKK